MRLARASSSRALAPTTPVERAGARAGRRGRGRGKTCKRALYMMEGLDIWYASWCEYLEGTRRVRLVWGEGRGVSD
jgi:hypothetical protein